MHTRLALAALAASSLTAFALDWPQWRGPARDEISKETGLLKTWPAGGPKRAWLYTNAGMGYAGFSVVGGKLFTMGTRDGKEALLALDAASGKELWATPVADIYSNKWGDGPRTTPSVDGAQVFALSGSGTLLCAQVADGKPVWTRTMAELGGKPGGWGYTESVLVAGAHVFCTPGGAQGAIAALDKKTGATVWQSKGFTDGAQYSSLVPTTIHGVAQVVQLTMQSIVGIAAKDGSVLWRSEWPGRTAVIPTPIVRGDEIFVTAGYGAGCKKIKVKPDGTTEEVFRNQNLGNHHGGVALLGDFLYGHSDKGGWTCLDWKTGDVKWQEKKLGKGALGAVADGRAVLVDERSGEVVLIEPSPDGWKEHGRFKLDPQTSIRAKDGAIWVHPVVANGVLYLRDQDHLYAYAVK